VTAPGWQLATDERSVRFSPAWFRLVDELTGLAPFERVHVRVDQRDVTGWRSIDVPTIVTAAGMVAFPGLERRRETAGVAPGHYRLKVDAEFYRPLYREQADGVTFEAAPHNDEVQPPAPSRTDLFLLPSVTYPYSAHIRTLRGIVQDQSGAPVEDGLVSTQAQIGLRTRLDRTLTDGRGAFALPLRWVALGSTASVSCIDRRRQRGATITVNFPDDVGQNRLITIS
jgi:hypothetical protein